MVDEELPQVEGAIDRKAISKKWLVQRRETSVLTYEIVLDQPGDTNAAKDALEQGRYNESFALAWHSDEERRLWVAVPLDGGESFGLTSDLYSGDCNPFVIKDGQKVIYPGR